ncbi:MAG: copper resistance CopC family protein [Mycetocola sp.]
MSRRRRAAIAVTAGAFLALGFAVPAQAHDQLISSTPAEGETLETAPAEIVTVFSDNVLDTGATLIVTDASGENRAVGDPEINGDTVSIEVDQDSMVAGDATVAWRVVSSDGHPIEGVIAFSVTTGAEETPAAAETESATETAPAEDQTMTTQASDTATPAETADDSTGSGPLPWVLGGVALLAAVAVLIGVLRRRSPQGPNSADGANGPQA